MQSDKIRIIKGKTRKYFYRLEDLEKAKELLARYLKGERVSFKMRLRLDDFSPFTRRVLQIVRTIPYGETRSYGWVAKKIGLAKASRAIGQALKRNPLTIIIPCHRVIRSNGGPGGFSRGVKLKKILLAKEGKKVIN